jgi:nucleoid DNA-binding protein
MNKADLIEQVAKTTKMSHRAAREAVEATLRTIKAYTKKEGVNIVGFGSFSVSKRKARTGRNPQTGAKIQIKASKGVRFRAGKAFKTSL